MVSTIQNKTIVNPCLESNERRVAIYIPRHLVMVTSQQTHDKNGTVPITFFGSWNDLNPTSSKRDYTWKILANFGVHKICH